MSAIAYVLCLRDGSPDKKSRVQTFLPDADPVFMDHETPTKTQHNLFVKGTMTRPAASAGQLLPSVMLSTDSAVGNANTGNATTVSTVASGSGGEASSANQEQLGGPPEDDGQPRASDVFVTLGDMEPSDPELRDIKVDPKNE